MYTQHFHSSRGCLSYITYDPTSKLAALIDPSTEIATAVYLDFLSMHDLKLKYIFETHTHADHVSSARKLKEATGAQVVRHKRAPSSLRDIAVEGGEEFAVGDGVLRVLSTPGHTNESISLYNGSDVFTGDALLIGGTGRTDFQVGDSASLYQSLHFTLENLPPETFVRPAHDYKGRNKALLGDEIRTNPRMAMCESEFIHTLEDYHPPAPELFAEAIHENSQ